MSTKRDGRQRYSPVSTTRLRSLKRRLARPRTVSPPPIDGSRMNGTSSPAVVDVVVARARNASTYCSRSSGIRCAASTSVTSKSNGLL